jgi:hypothetical protein
MATEPCITEWVGEIARYMTRSGYPERARQLVDSVHASTSHAAMIKILRDAAQMIPAFMQMVPIFMPVSQTDKQHEFYITAAETLGEWVDEVDEMFTDTVPDTFLLSDPHEFLEAARPLLRGWRMAAYQTQLLTPLTLAFARATEALCRITGPGPYYWSNAGAQAAKELIAKVEFPA